jgi:hypothetical protein
VTSNYDRLFASRKLVSPVKVASCDVRTGVRFGGQPDRDDAPEGVVGLTVSTTIELVASPARNILCAWLNEDSTVVAPDCDEDPQSRFETTRPLC